MKPKINSMKRFLILLLAMSVFACQPSEKQRVVGLVADSAMVVSAHPLASEVGVAILKKGGNAVDAAIATHFALAVVFPAAGNIGGGGFMVLRKQDGTTASLDYREVAPGKATETMYQDEQGEVIPDLSTLGHLAAGVPGSVDGMAEAHEKHGSLPWADLLQPAIDLALNGFALTAREADNFNRVQDGLKKYNTIEPSHLINDWKEGDTVTHIDLGHTLERIRDQGRAGFYEGKTADDIVAEMERGKGLISHEDLKNYKSTWRDVVTGRYKEYKIISMPPPSSGGVALIQLLKSVEPFPIQEWGHNTAKSVHIMVEAERRAYADRSYYLGDPDYFKVPVAQLIDDQYVDDRMSDLDLDRATPSAQVKQGHIAGYESEETTHISVVDPMGNAVAMTTTINEWFGNKVVVAGSGFFLNDEMDDFSAKPGVPNIFGVIGGEANKIEPGKTMLSSMTPTIVEKDNKLFMVIGSPGGSTIITSVFQVILNVTQHDMSMQEAVDARRIHSQWLPDLVIAEERSLTDEVRATLEQMGHTIQQRSNIGRVDAILVMPDGKLEGGADGSRGDDTARGY